MEQIKSMKSNISVNIDRLWSSLSDMAKIGPGIAGGNNRQTLTIEDGERKRTYFKNGVITQI